MSNFGVINDVQNRVLGGVQPSVILWFIRLPLSKEIFYWLWANPLPKQRFKILLSFTLSLLWLRCLTIFLGGCICPTNYIIVRVFYWSVSCERILSLKITVHKAFKWMFSRQGENTNHCFWLIFYPLLKMNKDNRHIWIN